MSYSLVAGDLGPTMPIGLMDNGTPFVLDTMTDTVALNYVGVDKIARTIALTIVNAATGSCEAAWVAGDLPVVGAYQGQVKVTREGDDSFPRSFPNDGSFLVFSVYRSLPAGVGGSPFPGAAYYGFSEHGTDPLPTDASNYLWLNSDGSLRLTVGGVTSEIATGGTLAPIATSGSASDLSTGTVPAARLPPPPNQISLTSGEGSSVPPGTPVYLSAAGTFSRAKADAAATGRTRGLTIALVSPSLLGIVQTGDTLTLTTSQWDAIAGTSGGLSFDVPYYLSPTTAGALTATPPSTAGQVVQQVIVGVSPTTAIVKISDPEVLGSGANSIKLRNDNAGALIIGTPVYTSSAGGADEGIANGSGKSVIEGLVGDTSIASGARGVVVVGGLMVATTVQWDAICGTSGGLAPNTPYYLSITTPGRLTSIAPEPPGDDGNEVVQVITSLSSTEARVAITTPVLL